jgi:branched-chain amino acid transport system substrate-binding protein
LFSTGRSVVAFLPAVTDIHGAGAKAAKGLLLAKSSYCNQNERPRSFANSFVPITIHMTNAARAAVGHYLRAPVATNGQDAGPINQKMRRAPVSVSPLRIDGRLSLVRVKPPEALRDDRDHFEPVALIPAADTYRPLNQTDCKLPLRPSHPGQMMWFRP